MIIITRICKLVSVRISVNMCSAIRMNLNLSSLKRFLEKISCQECNLANLKKVIIELRKQEVEELESFMICVPIFTEWINNTVNTWSVLGATPPLSLAVFSLHLVAILSHKEEIFCALNNNNFFIKLIRLSKTRKKEDEVKTAYIELLWSFLRHQSGIAWITACTFWENVLNLNLTDKQAIIKKNSCRFLVLLLENCEDSFCNEVVCKITKPLSNASYNCLLGVIECDELASQCLRPTIQLINNILEYFLDKTLFDGKDFRIPLMFFKYFRLQENISNAMTTLKPDTLLFDYVKLMFTMKFLELYVKTATKTLTISNIKQSMEDINRQYLATIPKDKNFESVIRLCCFAQFYWKLIERNIPFVPQNGKRYLSLGGQLITLQLLPCYLIIVNHNFPKSILIAIHAEDFRDTFYHKMVSKLSQDVLRHIFRWKDILVRPIKENNRNPHYYDLASKILLALNSSYKYLSKEEATIIFQSFMYSSNDFITGVKMSQEKLEKIDHDLDYFSKVLHLKTCFLKSFDITWADSVEIVDLMTLLCEFLLLPKTTKELTKKTLNLINVAIAKYMAPNMTLLMESNGECTIDLIGSLISTKVQDDDIGVKLAALEVVCTMASSKFPSLQKVLMDSELPTLVVKMSACDGESFVRATAIKCLQEMIQVEEIWNNVLKGEDLAQKMRDILLNETEGIVRVEAATFMCVAYENQQLPQNMLDQIYETMIYSSTADLHWEVKVRALAFWDHVIKNHLQNQGMIDGSFPNVTFSKEHRKIVTLTDVEIRKRLLKVLSQLSSIGCLGVLMTTIKDDCDVEVAKTGVKIAQRLIDLLKKYNVTNESAPTSPLPETCTSVSSGISVDESMESKSEPDFNEEVVNQIVNSKDATLLKNVYTESDYGSVNNYDIQVRKIVKPNDFLAFTQQDLNELVREKKKWLNGIEDLGSLLDDMLKSYDADVNNMDCY